MQDTRQANRNRRATEEADRGRAREALNLALDRIGARLATPEEAIDLVRLAGQAFANGTAARKLTTVLWRFVSSTGGKQ